MAIIGEANQTYTAVATTSSARHWSNLHGC